MQRMSRAILYTPSDEAVDRSLDARTYVQRLSRRLEVQRRFYDAAAEDLEIPGDVESVAVLSGLSALELASGYMEMELDTIFREMVQPTLQLFCLTVKKAANLVGRFHMLEGEFSEH